MIESTANGLNEFSTMWEKAENKENTYRPFFFSWIDDKLMFKEEYAEFVKRYVALHGAELTLDELDENEQTYYKMGASLEQLMWRRIKIMNSSESQFRQEYPATPLEAFVTSGNNIFDSERVQKEYNRVKLVKTINNLIPTLKVYKNYIKLWKAPERGMKYYIGVDASEGIGQDFSVISVYEEYNGIVI